MTIVQLVREEARRTVAVTQNLLDDALLDLDDATLERDGAEIERDELRKRIDQALEVLETLPPLPNKTGAAYWQEHASNVERLMSRAIRILGGKSNGND